MSVLPVVSVLLPAYNAEKYIGMALESLLDQTLHNFEVIVVDDGSRDKTSEIVAGYCARDTRVRLIQQSNAGIVRALNVALNAAQGEYSARMDSDDVCSPLRLQVQYEFLEKNSDVVLVGSRAYMIDEDGDLVKPLNVLFSNDDINAALLREKKCINETHLIHPTVMFKTASAKRIGGYREGYLWAEDRDFFLRIGETGKLANLEQTLLYYRYHSSSVSKSKADVQQKSMLKAICHARERRGMEPRVELVQQQVRPRNYSKVSVSKHSIRVAIWAICSGNVRTAMKQLRRSRLRDIITIGAARTLVASILPSVILSYLRRR